MIVGCSSDSSDDLAVLLASNPGSGLTYSSIADDMRECAPDLGSSAITLWEDGDNGWSGHVTYGVLKKHFDSTSGSESIYATVLLVDETLSAVVENMSLSAWESQGEWSGGGWDVTHELVDGNVTLPSIFGGGVVSDFENYLTISGTVDESQYDSYFHYKQAGDDGIEKILYRFENAVDNECGAIYATRNSSTEDITVWIASHKAPGAIPADGSVHENDEFRCLLYFEGNIEAQSFKFKLKTDAATGWAFWGGGSTASDDDYIAVRGTDEADSQTYANDGGGVTDDSADTTYVVLTFGDMKDDAYDGGGYPKNGTAANLAAETDSSVGYIDLGDENCLYADIAAVQAFKYPEEKSELGFADN